MLQNKNGAKHNITKNVDLRKTFESSKTEGKLIQNNPILTAVIKNHLQSYDPRSPTQDFERTPIVIKNNFDEDAKLHKLDNEGNPCINDDSIYRSNDDSCLEVVQVSPDLVVPTNLYDKFIDLTLDDTIKETEEPLGSSTASRDVIESEISPCPKPTALLETNFDFVETDQEKFEDGNEEIEMADECKEISKCDIKNIPLFKILAEDPRSPSTGIERTPIVVPKTEDSVNNSGNVEEMSDDSLIKALQITNTELCQNIVPEKNNGIIIYEDESEPLNETPKKSKSASSSGSRTPLSCMKNKTDTAPARSKSTNTLYDTKNKTKLQQKRVSHIPRLKSLIKQTNGHTGSSVALINVTKSSAISGDCENTPPHSERDRWDKDNSIIL